MTLNAVRRRTHAATFQLKNTAAALRAWRRGNGVSAYWYVGVPNLGDRLTPLLLEHYGFTPVHDRAARSRVVVVGSVLGRFPPDYDGVILGAGLLEDAYRPLVNARVLGVRGELTRERIGAPSETILGDPGLLASGLFDRARAKTRALGIVPHYVDQHDRRIQHIAERCGRDVAVIDVTRDPRQVLAEIDRCECILSSSLHGVVVADGLGIPNAWIALSDRVVGSRFKFRDYASALGRTIEPRRLEGGERLRDLTDLTTPSPASVRSVQSQLHEAFQKLKALLTA